MASLKNKKRNSNNSFLLTVILMVSLIVTILVPTVMAWFTDTDTGSSNTPINFGTVDINVEQNDDGNAKVEFTNLNSSARALKAVLPGDSIEFSFNVINTGNVDTYAKVNFTPQIMYGEDDITPLLYETTTDPVNQPYWIIDNTNITTDNPDFYTGGDQNNQVFVLATSEKKQIKGVLQFSTKLPNSVTDGTNTYVLNGHEKNKVKLILDIDMAAIQKDNIILTDAVTELNKHVDSMAINYSFIYLGGTPTLTVAGKPVITNSYYEVNSTENTKAYAFVSEINGEKTLLAVVGEGDMDNYGSATQPWKNFRSNITEVTVDEGITSIGNYAFYSCTSLTSANIPNSVQSIGNYAFGNCSSLTSINIPNNVQSIGDFVFYGCTSLTSAHIPNNVQSIGNSVFSGCKSLTSINIPNGVQSIGKNTFSNCKSLTSINIPNSVQSIGEFAFNFCASLTSIMIPDSVQSIGDFTFRGCTSLTSIVIPNSVQSIGAYAFSDGTAITNINIPNGVQSISEGAFNNCTSLASIVIPDSVQSIGTYAFENCSSLTSINIPNSVQSIGNSAFRGCTSLTSANIPNNLQSIGYSVFNNCTSLTSINIPNSVQSIGGYAFGNCSSLTNILIPDSVQTIYASAFENCTSLTNLIIPDSVQAIYGSAFSGFTSTQTIYIEHKSSSEISNLNSNWLKACQANVVWFSETNQAGYWHYDTDGITPVLW